MYYKNGELYIGNWVENKKQGEGMHFYINGDRYVGEWKEDQKDGEGTIYQADHNIFHGSLYLSQLRAISDEQKIRFRVLLQHS